MLAESSENEPQKDGSPACGCTKETFGCLIHPNTRDEWIASMRDSLARISVELGLRRGSKTERAADFTEKCSELLASFDPATCSWKTSQQSLLPDSEPSLETWPRAGLMRGGRVYRHRQPVPRTTVIGGGVLQSVPTPTVTGNHNRKGASKKSGDGLATWVRWWPTPTASAAKGSSPASLTRKNERDRRKDRLDHAVMASDGGQLNPLFVEWLMGWPLNWTALAGGTSSRKSGEPLRESPPERQE